MAERCFMCGRAATAGGNPHVPQRGKCVRCASLTCIEIPITLEKLAPAPPSIVQGPAWPLAKDAARGDELWLHQSHGLAELEAGNNIVMATSTASGKTLVFQLWAVDQLKRDPQATVIIFYPTKALANDQARRWNEACRVTGLPVETVGQIDGDVTNEQRDTIMRRARIIIATPDVTHAWMLRRALDQGIRRFLGNLRLIVIDEAHTYESVFGSNAAYLMRRLTAASIASGATEKPRFIAATATIQSPDEHLEKLTGETFTVIDEMQNGSPRFSRELLHLPMSANGGNGEEQLAKLVTDIIDNDPDAQVIAFHDSRMGVERIVQRINRPEEVLPYRSGYLAADRRAIETQLRNNSIRAVISTSALELGIDMPDLTYGINLDLPPSRKQFHQRLGRVGRAKPGTFIILAPANRFSTYGETLRDYYDNSVEPSHLYLDNEYINYQQAMCLKDELERARRDTKTPPNHTEWPETFEEALRNAHGRPPLHLQNLSTPGGAPPQIANSLRSSGEEQLQIVTGEKGQREENIGYINLQSALDEAYPGAIHFHHGKCYNIEEWARKRDTLKGYIRAIPISRTNNRTWPNNRHVATMHHDQAMIISHRPMPTGSITERRIDLIHSVEGYENAQHQNVLYRNEMTRDPRMSRKQRLVPTTAVQLRIRESWFAGGSGDPWQARHQIAQALRLHLSYRRSIALPDIGYRVENIFQETPQGFVELEDSILVHDNIYGGMGLVSDLQQNIERYARSLNADISGEPGTVYPQHVEALIRWLEREGEEAEEAPAAPGPESWWRVVRAGSPVTVFSAQQNKMVSGEIRGYEWRNAVVYLVDIDGENAEVRDNQIRARTAPLDFQLWRPQGNGMQELQAG